MAILNLLKLIPRYLRQLSNFLSITRFGAGRQALNEVVSAGPFFSSVLMVSSLILLIGGSSAQAQMRPKLKEFLTRNDIMDLIERYGQDKIELTIKGVEQVKIEQRSYNVVPGFRCQVFAGSQLDNADQVAAEVRALQLDSVYVVQTPDNLVKVQVGNFLDRKDALVMVDRLRYSGVGDAWIVETDIHVPKETPPEDVEKKSEVKNVFYFAVQVFNTKHYEKAQSYKASLERRFSEPVEIIPQNDLWKIVVGRFEEHESASALLERMHSEGFADAWITQVVD